MSDSIYRASFWPVLTGAGGLPIVAFTTYALFVPLPRNLSTWLGASVVWLAMNLPGLLWIYVWWNRMGYLVGVDDGVVEWRSLTRRREFALRGCHLRTPMGLEWYTTLRQSNGKGYLVWAASPRIKPFAREFNALAGWSEKDDWRFP